MKFRRSSQRVWLGNALLAVFLALTCQKQGQAQVIVSETDGFSGATYWVGLPQNLGQSFTVEPGQSLTVSMIEFLYADANTSSADPTISLGLFEGVGPGANLLHAPPPVTLTSFVDDPSFATNLDPTFWVGFSFPDLLLTPGVYSFVVSAGPARGGAALDTDRYPGGYLFSTTGGLFISVPISDLLFRIHGTFGTYAPPVSGRVAPSPPVLLVDEGAILSAHSTGLMMAGMNRHMAKHAYHVGIRDLNKRLTRSRQRGLGSGNASAGKATVVSTMNSSEARYLDFAARQNIDYRVALGLADGEELGLVDSLQAADAVWAGHPLAMLAGPVMFGSGHSVSAKAVVAVPEGSGKNPLSGKDVITDGDLPGRFEFFTEFDFGYYDQEDLTQTMRGFESDTYAGSLGVEYRVFDWLNVGGAFTHVWSDAEATSSLGSIDLEGQFLSGYLSAFWRQWYFDALYSYGNFNSDLHRDTLLGRAAQGNTDSFSHNIAFNTGWNLQLSDRVSTGPFAGLDYSTGGIDGYRETGGGTANLIYPDDNFESMVSRLGWQASHRSNSPFGVVTTGLFAGWAHEFMPETGPVSASLQTSPFLLVNGNSAHRIGGYTAEGNGAHAGQDWLELGANIQLDFAKAWNLLLGYEGQFARNNSSAHFASVKLSYEWGDYLFRSKRNERRVSEDQEK